MKRASGLTDAALKRMAAGIRDTAPEIADYLLAQCCSKADESVMKCRCGDLRGIGEMHVTMRGTPSPPAIVEVMCVDCVLSEGWSIDLTATMSDLIRHEAKDKRGT